MLLAVQETVKAGYDKFIIVDGASGFRSEKLGEFPAQASGDAYSFRATGPQEIRRNRYETALTIKMFRAGDPMAANAVDAQQVLKTAPKQ